MTDALNTSTKSRPARTAGVTTTSLISGSSSDDTVPIDPADHESPFYWDAKDTRNTKLSRMPGAKMASFLQFWMRQYVSVEQGMILFSAFRV